MTEPSETRRASAGSFWDGYWKSLKPLSVEEPIDVWVHRPLAYVFARVLLPTPVSPNLVTLFSILLGIGAGIEFAIQGTYHHRLAGALLFASAVADCADGQLARMRGTSSRFGRMLDGVADLVVAVAAVSGAILVIWRKHHDPAWVGIMALALSVATAVTGSFHTSMYDHYKNVFLRLTTPSFREGEDYADAVTRYEEHPKAEFGPLARLAWPIYLFYVKSQEDFMRSFDPFTAPRLSSLPPYSEQTATVYRAKAEGLMRIWKSWFGFGSLMFGIAVSTFLNILDWYMLARLIGMNAVFYGYLRPRQRRASREAFRALGVSFEASRTAA